MQVRDLELWRHYQSNDPVKLTVERLLCLPYFPPQVIPEVYEFIKSAEDILEPVFEYLDRVWINSNSLYNPKKWSIYGKAVRTNNHAEGEHRKWNAELCKNPLFYLLSEYMFGNASKLLQDAQL